MSHFVPAKDMAKKSNANLNDQRKYVYDKVCKEIADVIAMATLVGMHNTVYKLPNEPENYAVTGVNSDARVLVQLQRVRTYAEQVKAAMDALTKEGYEVRQMDSATWNISWQK
ncbi:hypothetical protein PP740_gp016 [Stenotrophomonas phage Philippe]|uniref:Uncharacterized protein n=1 Tax=Stenotrophomonas phage Philippe TaxID=2859655 RepID=A0AAE8BI35_9CAUD|nr:hypothetical protein PP740_gp016 [Stenotrophomonas phage Philippe]QYW02215.1 hypothetical protein CPT_Philippe_016 [Stenotrophomonas phage Philippe]